MGLIEDKIYQMEQYAINNDIPIITSDGIEFIIKLIDENCVLNILEIGSAIGYSAIRMAIVRDDITVTTIERDVERYNIAKNNISEFNLQKRINILNIDAFDFVSEDKYDLIFIDGAKSQYTRWFEMYSKMLAKQGIIVCDNLNFHGHVENFDMIKTRNLRQLVTKIKKFINFLSTNEEYKTEFYNIGDGMSVSKRIENEN